MGCPGGAAIFAIKHGQIVQLVWRRFFLTPTAIETDRYPRAPAMVNRTLVTQPAVPLQQRAGLGLSRDERAVFLARFRLARRRHQQLW